MMDTGPATARPRHILLVDDDPLSLAVIDLMLTARGHSVISAGCGTNALQLLAEGFYDYKMDALLADMQMPGISGSKLASMCRPKMRTGAVLLAMSATRPSAEKLAGYDGFLQKPIDMDKLHSLLETPVIEPLDNGPWMANPDEEPDLDPEIYGKLSAMMPAASLAEIYSTCFSDTWQRVPLIQQSAAAGDLKEVRRQAHGIKGGCSMLGAKRLTALATHLELGNYSLDQVPELLRTFSVALQELERILLLPDN